MTRAQISGRALLGALKYAKARGPEGESGALIRNLPADDQAVFSQPLKAGTWYPYSTYASVLAAIESWPGDDREVQMRELGRWALQQDAGTVLKILSIFSSVEGLVHRGFGSWGAFLWKRHCDHGEVFLADHGTRTATMGLRNFATISPSHCRLTRGYLEAMGQAVGAQSMRMIKTRCVHRGDSHCEYRGEWD